MWELRPQSNFLANPSNREFQTPNIILKGFPDGSVVKNLSANAGDSGSIPGLGRSPEEGMGTHSSILAWRIPWTESLGSLISKL